MQRKSETGRFSDNRYDNWMLASSRKLAVGNKIGQQLKLQQQPLLLTVTVHRD